MEVQARFVHGLRLACLIAAAIVCAASLVVFAFLPARAADVREELEIAGPIEGVASVTFAEADAVLEGASTS